MKGYICLLVWVFCLYGAETAPYGPSYDPSDAPKLYVQYLKEYNKQYKDIKATLKHFDSFQKTLQLANELNQALGYKAYSVNNYSDYTEEEARKHLLVGYDDPNGDGPNKQDIYLKPQHYEHAGVLYSGQSKAAPGQQQKFISQAKSPY